ncbi:rhodanese-like domain-containing protein [Flavihumibacter sp. CACIAM 22H1]|uniref:rhodanese-like domain-containing protein n=1 Tax=Flavihumibacter sp. CACIAM 22H1 TaxID=1812911 RepID=UPI0007A82B20|nr:rhodanese-like domain-containing protein [Flavihumibacter sp. CACIAM 22H1]KYP16393.1 MAG: sulfurtransferase [Flavihumibacter sp. CACIAM 22H1]
MFTILKSIFGKKEDLKALREAGALIVDVRTPAEYEAGHIPGSSNIPLDQLKKQLAVLKKEGKAIIAVCRSGNRSALAVSQLKAAGINAYNGGAWSSLARDLK